MPHRKRAPTPEQTTPPVAEPSGYVQNSDDVLAAIRTFVEAVPLNRQTSESARPFGLFKVYGTIVLPLWRHTPPVDPTYKHWHAINTFLDGIWDHILHCNKVFREERPWTWEYAMMNQERKMAEAVKLEPARLPYLAADDPYVIEAANYGQSIMQNGTRGGHCFESLRLTANMVTDEPSLRTAHKSKWAVVSAFGDWKYGEATMHAQDGAKWLRFQEGQIHVVQTQQRFEFDKNFGPRYVLKLFLPDLNELVRNGQLGVPVKEGARRVKIEEGENGAEEESRRHESYRGEQSKVPTPKKLRRGKN